VPDLYDAKGPYSRASGFLVPGLAAWATGTAAYWIGGPHGGGSIPALVVSVVVYLAALRLGGRRAP
jgi:hypothetical protein